MLNTDFLNKTQLKIKNKIFYFILLGRTWFNANLWIGPDLARIVKGDSTIHVNINRSIPWLTTSSHPVLQTQQTMGPINSKCCFFSLYFVLNTNTTSKIYGLLIFESIKVMSWSYYHVIESSELFDHLKYYMYIRTMIHVEYIYI